MSTNPLSKHFRTPSLYTTLPSKGRWWPEGSLEMPLTGEIPVLPLTTRDEILLRTPDALLNGEGVVKAIESCCPSIKNAWKMPSIDVDSILINIRIASYGNEMELNHKCPHCGEANEFTIDLHQVLATIEPPEYNVFETHGLKIKLKPQEFFNNNQSKKLAFEEQQMLRFIATDPSEGDERARLFKERLDRVVDLTIKNLCDSTDYIETEDGTRVTNPEHIAEFYEESSGELLGRIKSELEAIKLKVDIKPLKVKCPEEECGKESELLLEFDYASFFASGS